MPNDFINEGEIPSNWVDSREIGTQTGSAPHGAPAPPVPNEMPQFFSGSVPPALQHDTSFVGTAVGTPRIPIFAVMPFGNQASPFTNAAAQSTATNTTTEFFGGGGVSQLNGLSGSVSLFSPDASILISPGGSTINLEANGVKSLNSLIGALSLVSSDSSVTITPSGSTIDLQASGGGGSAVEINGVGVSRDKQFYINAVLDGAAPVWGVNINGVAD
jgi:hypothetical protein